MKLLLVDPVDPSDGKPSAHEYACERESTPVDMVKLFAARPTKVGSRQKHSLLCTSAIEERTDIAFRYTEHLQNQKKSCSYVH
jgi:hypothetical protein